MLQEAKGPNEYWLTSHCSQPISDATRGRPTGLTFQIKRYLDTSPSSDFFTPEGYQPHTERPKRIKEHISEFVSINKAASLATKRA